MRSLTSRLLILMLALLIAVIIGMQVYWLSKTYSFEKNEFNTSVLKSIRGVYEDIPLLYKTSITLDSLVERQGENIFLFQVHTAPSRDSLTASLSSELEDFKVFTDCIFGMYDYRTGKYVYENYLSTDASRKEHYLHNQLKTYKRNYNYVQLYFPNRSKYIISQMENWVFASIVLLVLLIGLSFSLYYFFRQKFLVEVQKDFINNVTHEFSTPLSVIEISVDGLKKPAIATQPDKYRKYVDSIQYQADYLKSHIANLVKTVVADKYRFELHKKEISPDELLKRAVAQLEPLLSKSNGRVEWKLHEKEIHIQADEENLYLAFFNIISNSIKYSPVPHIVISSGVKGGFYYASIKDDGAGIEPSEIKNIFKKFYRVQRGNIQSAKGLGLGLYFVKKVVDGHNGHIIVNSVPSAGAEFIIELPLKENL